MMLNRLKVLRLRGDDTPNFQKAFRRMNFQKALEKNTTIHELDLSHAFSKHSDGIRMQNRTKQALAHVLKVGGLSNLGVLNLDGCTLGDAGADMLLNALNERPVEFDRILHINLTDNGLSSQMLDRFRREQCNRTIESEYQDDDSSDGDESASEEPGESDESV